MNLVLGATGVLGYEICRLLISEGRPVRAMVRNPFEQGRTLKLREMGVQLVQGDLRNRKTFGPVLKGVSHVVSTASSMPSSYIAEENDIRLVDKNGMMDFIDSAVEYGVSHFIYTSFSGNINLDFPLRNAKRTVEQHLRKSGMTFTILRPGFFMEVWLSAAMGFDIKNEVVQIYGTGRHPVSYISYRDVAKFAAKSINNTFARNLTIELGGPGEYTQFEVAQLFEEVRMTKFEYRNIPEEKLLSQMKNSLDPMQKSIAGLMLSLAGGDSIDMNYILKAFHLKLRSVRDFAEIKVPSQ